MLLSCEVLAAKLKPVSTKAAMPTGPTMGMRYSMLLTMLVSPPGALMRLMGSATNTLPRRGFVGSSGTGVPSGFTSVRLTLSGTNTYGEMVRISKPRRSFSPPR